MLRIVLAVGVFAAHAWDQLPKHFGNFCVQSFFALSGFLVGGILLKTKVGGLPKFYFGRVSRIWIPYTIGILLLALGCIAKRQVVDGKLLEFFFYKATFVYNLFGTPQLTEFKDRMPLQGTGNHYWSLCVEEQFYLFAPALLIFARPVRAPALALMVIANVFSYGSPNFASVAAGVLLAISRERFGDWFLRGPAPALLTALGIGLSCSAVGGLLPYAPTIPLAAVAIVAAAAVPGKKSAVWEVLGGMSYPFYLNHWTGLVLRKTLSRFLGGSSLLVDLVALSIGLGLSWLHFMGIDRMIRKHRYRWYSPRVGIVCAVGAFALFLVGIGGGLALTH